MPPQKRAKKASPVARRSSSSPAPPPSDIVVDEKENDPTKKETNATPPNKEAPTFNTALLDEEELPNQPSSNTFTGGHGYNTLKFHNGQVYTGMAVGGSHTWNYDPGVWKETKVEPDLWKIDFETTKRRAKNAPKGSGAPVGMAYHWVIVAHQYVTKIDANTYETHLVGSKYKLAHKGPDTNSWSINSVKGQREKEVELLEDAKRKVQGLPPVLGGEKVKVDKRERGQQKLDALFGNPARAKGGNVVGTKRRREDGGDDV